MTSEAKKVSLIAKYEHGLAVARLVEEGWTKAEANVVAFARLQSERDALRIENTALFYKVQAYEGEDA